MSNGWNSLRASIEKRNSMLAFSDIYKIFIEFLFAYLQAQWYTVDSLLLKSEKQTQKEGIMMTKIDIISGFLGA